MRVVPPSAESAHYYGSAQTNFCCWPLKEPNPRNCLGQSTCRTAILELASPALAHTWVINAFCALDLHHSAFPIGMCTRTVFGKAEIMLWRTEADTFRIEVARSFAPYVWACLDEARQEFVRGGRD